MPSILYQPNISGQLPQQSPYIFYDPIAYIFLYEGVNVLDDRQMESLKKHPTYQDFVAVGHVHNVPTNSESLPQLETPNIKSSEYFDEGYKTIYRVIYDKVANDSGYHVEISEDPNAENRVVVRVKALGDGKNFSDSAYGEEPASRTDAPIPLDKPELTLTLE